MRVARIGDLFLPVPAEAYGGTERSMAQMTVLQAAICAHDITLYAAADSQIILFAQTVSRKMGLDSKIDPLNSTISITNADGRVGYIKFKSAGISSLTLDHRDPEENVKHNRLFLELLADEQVQPFDIIHCHTRRFMANEIIPRGLLPKTLVHHHNATLEEFYREHPYPLICISHSQAARLRKLYDANVFDVIHHGLDSCTYTATTEHAGYLAWIGRFVEEKGALRAINIAKATNKPLVIAGTVYNRRLDSEAYFREKILPHVDLVDPAFLDQISGMGASEVRREIAKTGKKNPIIFCGMATEPQKQALYGHALATLFPISWPEPFGRVLIESMACGTPVIGYAQIGDIHCGSIAEVIANGVTGYALVSRNEEDALQRSVEAVEQVSTLDRSKVRIVFNRDWSSERVARQIETAYRRYLALASSPTLHSDRPAVSPLYKAPRC